MQCNFKNKKLCKYPLISKPRQLKVALAKGNKYIENNISKKDFKLIQKIDRMAKRGQDSFQNCSTKQGKIKRQCENYHSRILKEQFKGVSSDRKDPDLYIMGGLPASGKTTVLRRFVPEKTVVIDNDFYKDKLAVKFKSPSKKYKLIHAGLLHNEGDVLTKKAIKRAIKQRKNVTLDMTFGNLEKGKKYIKRFKKAGYDIHYLGTQKYPHITMNHMAKRFVEKGRYVPLSYVEEKGNKISTNSWKARKYADSYIIYETNTYKPKFVAKSRRKIKDNVRNP